MVASRSSLDVVSGFRDVVSGFRDVVSGFSRTGSGNSATEPEEMPMTMFYLSLMAELLAVLYAWALVTRATTPATPIHPGFRDRRRSADRPTLHL